MIRINLDGIHQNNMSRAEDRMFLAAKLESVGYFDNPNQMDCGVQRCEYVRKKIERAHRNC